MKKFTNKFLSILMCLTMMLTIVPLSGIVPLVSAATYSGTCGDNLTWQLNTSTGVLDITGEGDMTDWSSADDVPWYSYTEDIKNVNIGDGVSNIGYCAFEDCSNLTNVIIPGSVTSVGNSAFEDCSNLTNIIIPDSVTIIGYRAFCRCTNLTSITIPNSVTIIGDYAFRNCTNLTSITIPVSVTNIGYSAFIFCNNLKDIYYCGTEEDWGKISIDSNNAIITNATLHYNHHLHSYVPSITKDSTCTEKGTKTYFCDCGDSYEEKIDLAKHNYENGACTKCGCKGYSGESADGRLVWSLDIENGILDVKGILDDRPWHPYKDYIKIVNILEGTTTISPSAFEDYANIEEVNISDSVECVLDYAFAGCDKLTNIMIPDTVKSIRQGAFACANLTSVSIPKYLEELNGCVFGRGNNIKDVYVTDIEAWFNFISIHEDFYGWSDCVLKYAENLYVDGKLLEILYIPNDVTIIENYTFSCFTCIKQVYISDSVEEIGEGAFFLCTGINYVYIGDSVKTIKDNSFACCMNMEYIDISKSLEYIGTEAFYSCDNLAFVNFRGLETDWNKIYIETGNGSLENTTIYHHKHSYAENITKESTCIEKGIRTYTCDCGDSYEEEIDLIKHNYENGACTECGKKGYSGTCGDNLTWTLDTDTGVLDITGEGDMTSYAPWHSYWSYIKTVNIGDSVTSIGNYAFAECRRLTSAMIPDSVTSIGDYAFCECISLTSITIGNSVTSIGDYAFGECTSLTSITIPDSVTSIGSYAFCNTAYYNDSNNWTDGVLYISNRLIKAETSISGSYTIKEGTKTIADSAFDDCYRLTDVTIGNSVVSIGDYAFQACYSLTSITIPDSVESIGMRAFENCYLTDIVLGKSVKSIGDFAFAGCYLLENVFYSGGKDDWNKINIGIVNSILTNARIHYNSSSVHSYVERILQPTCTQDGYKLCVCECDNVYIEEHIDALGHSYKNGVCINCGKTTGGISVPDNSSVVIDKEKGLISGLDMSLDKDGLMQYLEISDDVTLTLSTDIIGTGTVITISDKATGNILETYTAVIFGDYNGDGVADIEDTGYFSSISNFEIFDYFENEYLFMAADINGDGVVDSMDEEDMYAVANYDAYIDFTITSGSKVIRY